MGEQFVRVVLAKRPDESVQEGDFRIVAGPLPKLSEGEVLVRNHYLSLDPYMRGRMEDKKSYAPSVKIGETMVGQTVGIVVESRNDSLPVGEHVTGMFGWQNFAVSNGVGVERLGKLDDRNFPLTAFLGAVGIPGKTAYFGLYDICKPKVGETIVVSSAAGAVGSVVGQLAKLGGCTVIGIAGGSEKCQYAKTHFGFDDCIDYKTADFEKRLAVLTKNGVDMFFDNVGGAIFDTVLTCLNPFSRIALCGTISDYGSSVHGIKNLRRILVNRVQLQGFIVTDYVLHWSKASQFLAAAIADGRIQFKEAITDGLENAPKAFVGMLRGENFGKQIVRIT